jgi:hypothetical protein
MPARWSGTFNAPASAQSIHTAMLLPVVNGLRNETLCWVSAETLMILSVGLTEEAAILHEAHVRVEASPGLQACGVRFRW